MKLPTDVRERFRQYGREGGRARAAGLDASERRRIGRSAVTTRWIRTRFGVSRFAELALPGADLVDQGLADLAAGRTTRESLLVSLAAPRLRREGVPVGSVEQGAARRLYDLVASTEGDRAHARYSAYLQRISSFADACHVVRSATRRA